MSTALRGLGFFGLKTTETNTPISQNEGFSPEHLNFDLTLERNTERILAFINGNATGIRKTFKTITLDQQYTLSMECVGWDWHFLQLLTDEFRATTASYTYDNWQRLTVPEAPGPYTIDLGDAGLTAVDDVVVSYVEVDGHGQPRGVEVVLVAPTDADEVQLALGVLTFDAAAAGAAVDVAPRATLTTNETIGVESTFNNVGSLEFTGVLKSSDDSGTQGIGLKIPQMEVAGGFSIAVGDDVNTFTLEYNPSVASGNRSEVEFFNFA